MRLITDEELDNMLPSEKHEWTNREIGTHSYSSGGTFSLPELKVGEPIMFQCLRCKSHYLIDPCSNCSNIAFETAQEGVFCKACEKGFRSWTCSNCETENPAKKTLFLIQKKSGGCFIATAACGTPLSEEVIFLASYRDDVLVKTYIGRVFIRIYNCFSPPISKIIEHNALSKTIVRSAIILPLVRFIRLTRFK